MPFAKITRSTTIEVQDHQTLLAEWSEWGKCGPARMLIGHFIVKQPLTKSQLARMPKRLRALLERNLLDSTALLKYE